MRTSHPITRKIFIMDDETVFLKSLANMLEREQSLKVVGLGAGGAGALSELPKLRPDLIVVDIGSPGRNGLEFIKKIRCIDKSARILVLSGYDEAIYAERALKLGADGYIMRTERPQEIVMAVLDVLDGHIYVSESIVNINLSGSTKPAKESCVPSLALLTEAELEVLEAFGHGMSDQETARYLESSVPVVTAQAAMIKRKLNLKSDNALVRYAVCWVERVHERLIASSN